MASFSESEREEIERIKSENYCGTQHALKRYRMMQELRDFAGGVSELLNMLRIPPINWQMGLALHSWIVAERHEEALEASLEREEQAQEEWRGVPEQDEKEKADDIRRMLTVTPLEAARVYVAMFAEAGENYQELRSLAQGYNEARVYSGDRTLVDEGVAANDGLKPSLPRHMAHPDHDTLYVRAKEEGTLHHTAIQQTFLIRTAQAANAASVEQLVDFLQKSYRDGQAGLQFVVLKEEEDLIPLFERHAQLRAEAAAYGLGLLRRSDLSGWLRKYLEA